MRQSRMKEQQEKWIIKPKRGLWITSANYLSIWEIDMLYRDGANIEWVRSNVFGELPREKQFLLIYVNAWNLRRLKFVYNKYKSKILFFIKKSCSCLP